MIAKTENKHERLRRMKVMLENLQETSNLYYDRQNEATSEDEAVANEARFEDLRTDIDSLEKEISALKNEIEMERVNAEINWSQRKEES